jgi:hypothetical protein
LSVHVEGLAAGGQQVHLQQVVAGVVGQPAHAIAAVAEGERDFIAVDGNILLRRLFAEPRGPLHQRS